VEPCLQIEFVEIEIIVGDLLVIGVGVFSLEPEPFQDLMKDEKN